MFAQLAPRVLRILAVAVIVFVSPLSLSPQTELDLRYKVADFELKYDPFVRKLFGCPPIEKVPHILDPAVCNQHLGTISYPDYRKARESAKKLFDLKDVHAQ